MIATHWRVPDAPLRASAATAQLIGLGAVIALAAIARRVSPLGDLYALKAAATFGAIVLFSFGFLHRHHPFTRFGPANQITTVRAILVALAAGVIGEPRVPVLAASAAGIGLFATALDGLDGWLARRTRIASAFGARFDMEIDALLILVLSILVWQFGKAGIWVIASGLLRYVFTAAGAIWSWLAASLPQSRRRQAICVLQIVSLTLALIPMIAPPFSTTLAAVALLLLSYSFLVDTASLWRQRACR
jgi:phosphatidylglycerophosphate synthase